MIRHLIALFLFAVAVSAFAETRGEPYNHEELLAQSTSVFVGEVMETKTYDSRKRTVPTRCRVLLSIKGRDKGERSIVPKDPGVFAYFNEEFSQARKADIGVFYVGNGDQPDLLLAYRRIGKAGDTNRSEP